MTKTPPPVDDSAPTTSAVEQLAQAVLDGRILISWQGPYFDDPVGWRVRVRPKGKR